jgi:hypothetical protein
MASFGEGVSAVGKGLLELIDGLMKHGFGKDEATEMATKYLKEGEQRGLLNLPAAGVDPITTRQAFKLAEEQKDGTLLPLFVGRDTPFVMDEWNYAKVGDLAKDGKRVKSKIGPLSYRAGLHAGSDPYALHIGGKSGLGLSPLGDPSKPDYRKANQKWMDIEVPDDYDWTSEGISRAPIVKSKDSPSYGKPDPAKSDIKDQLPFGGSYDFNTSSNVEGNWVISDKMKPTQLLDQDQVAAINAARGNPHDLPTLDRLIEQHGITRAQLNKESIKELKDNYPELYNTLKSIGGMGLIGTLTAGASEDAEAGWMRAPSGLIVPDEAGAPIRTFKKGDVGYDPRYDERANELDKLAELETTREKAGVQYDDIPEISIFDLEGRPFVTTMSDRTDAGGLLTAINGINLKDPVSLTGGQGFMFNNPYVWASGKAPITKIENVAKQLMKDNVGYGDPVLLPWRMAPTGSDFSAMTGETMMSFARSNMDRAEKRYLNNAIKEIVPNWKGIDSPKAIENFNALPATERAIIQNLLDKNFRDYGGMGIGETRLAISEPSQLDAVDGGLQNVGLIDMGRGRALIDNPSYPEALYGEGMGRLKEHGLTIGALDGRTVGEMREGRPNKYADDPFNKPSPEAISSSIRVPKGGVIDEKLLRNIERGIAAGLIGTTGTAMADEEALANALPMAAQAAGQSAADAQPNYGRDFGTLAGLIDMILPLVAESVKPATMGDSELTEEQRRRGYFGQGIFDLL